MIRLGLLYNALKLNCLSDGIFIVVCNKYDIVCVPVQYMANGYLWNVCGQLKSWPAIFETFKKPAFFTGSFMITFIYFNNRYLDLMVTRT